MLAALLLLAERPLIYYGTARSGQGRISTSGIRRLKSVNGWQIFMRGTVQRARIAGNERGGLARGWRHGTSAHLRCHLHGRSSSQLAYGAWVVLCMHAIKRRFRAVSSALS